MGICQSPCGFGGIHLPKQITFVMIQKIHFWQKKSIFFSLILSVCFASAAHAENLPPTLPEPPNITDIPSKGEEKTKVPVRPTKEEFFPQQSDPDAQLLTTDIPPSSKSPNKNTPPTDDTVSRNAIFLWGFVIAVLLGSLASKGKRPSAKQTTVSKQYDGDV